MKHMTSLRACHAHGTSPLRRPRVLLDQRPSEVRYVSYGLRQLRRHLAASRWGQFEPPDPYYGNAGRVRECASTGDRCHCWRCAVGRSVDR